MDRYPTFLLLFINCVFEEVVFRMTIIYLCSIAISHELMVIILSALIFASAHILFFKFYMFIITFILGFILAYIYLSIPHLIVALWSVIFIHFLAVYIGTKSGIIHKLTRR